MRNTRNRRGKSGRMLTVGEIKRAICNHEKLSQAGPSEQRVAGGIWQTKLTCPTCGAWTIRETPNAISLTPVILEQERDGTTDVVPAWEECAVELRCQERQARMYPLCRYEAIAAGPTGRYLAGASPEFDNGIEQVDRQVLLDAFAVELLRDRWQREAPTVDRMPRFRRQLESASAVHA